MSFLNKRVYTAAGKFLFSMIEVCGLIPLLMIMRHPVYGRKYTWLTILIEMVTFSISASGNGLSSNILKNSRVTHYLGKLSFAVCLVHFPMVVLFMKHFQDKNELYEQKLLFVLVVLAEAILFLLFMEWFVKLCKRVGNYLASVIVQTK